MHYRHLERKKILALQANKGDYDATMSLSKEARSELYWWVTNVITAFKNIMETNPDLILTTDASNTGWGAVCEGQQTGRLWSVEEQCSHINSLEIKAVLFGLQSLCSNFTDKHIRIQSDNTNTVSYINAMGGIKLMAAIAWHYRFGSGAVAEIFGLAHATFQAFMLGNCCLKLGQLSMWPHATWGEV